MNNKLYIVRYFFLYTLFYLTLCFIEKTIFLVTHSHLINGDPFAEAMGALAFGIRFDLAVAAGFALITLPFRLFFCHEKRYRPGFFYVMTGIALLLIQFPHMGDIIYFTESQRHMGYEALELFADPKSMVSTALGGYAAQISFQIPLFLIFFKLAQMLFLRPIISTPRRQAVAESIFAIVCAAVMMRGGLQAVPMSPMLANGAGSPQKAALALNGVYNAFYAALNSYNIPLLFVAPRNDPIRPEEIAAFYQKAGLGNGRANANPMGEKRYNVVILFLESWDAYRIASYGYEKDVAPFFDSLRKKSLTTKEMLAGGLRTTEGIFSLLCSYPNPLGKTIPGTRLEQYQYDCLPQEFAQRGYRLAFFQGTFENTVYTGDFVKKLGFQESYGKEDIKGERYPRNTWGVHDPDLYDFMIQKMDESFQRDENTPFFFGVNTATTHDKEVPPGVTPFGEDQKENVLHFADEALARFFEEISGKPYFQNTVFVLAADHTSFVKAESFHKYRIPFLIYSPSLVKPRMVNTIAAQRDIAPTLLAILQMEVPPHYAGKSLLAGGYRFADYYHQGMVGWVEQNRIVEFPAGKPQEAACFSYPQILSGPAAKGECREGESAMIRRAQVFTDATQGLMFEGRTTNYGEAP